MCPTVYIYNRTSRTQVHEFIYICLCMYIFVCHVKRSKYIYKKRRHLFVHEIYFGFF